MSRLLIVLVAVMCISLSTRTAFADLATPFLEGPAAEVGAISEGHGFVLAADNSDDGPGFLVMVTSDTGQYLVITARAEKGIVPANLIGRPVVIKAQVTKKGTKSGRPEGFELKVLGVTSTRKEPAPAK